MPEILRIKEPGDYARYLGVEAPNPLVAVIDFTKASPIRHSLNDYGVYAIFLQENNDLELTYGCGRYDFNEGSLICVAPGQIGGKEYDGTTVNIGGWGLVFHSDLLRYASLGEQIKSCTFFDYRINEALRPDEHERKTVTELFRQIEREASYPGSPGGNEILASYISLLLSLCKRMFQRQFDAVRPADDDILKRFYGLLNDFYAEGQQGAVGIPTVSYCAEQLFMSPNYLSDIVKRHSGQTAGAFIRHFIIRMAQNELAGGKSISETAYSLGFDYPQHLSRMFKRQTGMSPRDYIRSLSGSDSKKHRETHT